MEWAAQQGVKVANISLGGLDTPEQDLVEAALEQLTAERGVLFVVAAGNSGGDGTIASPGSSDSALTVGAVTKSDDLATFSSRGPRVGDFALKPDITGPGVSIVAANGKDSAFGTPGEAHVAMSGTSMATPHVAGAAAILAQKHPTWTPAQLKAALMGSAKTNPAIGVHAQGAGRVDVPNTLAQTVLAETPSISFGRQLWPHTDDEKIIRTVTYRNTGRGRRDAGPERRGTAPAGTFTLSATTVSVPAGGTAAVTLTADTRVASPDVYLGGHVVAVAPGHRITTPFAVDKEVESYNLALERIGRDGDPATVGNSYLVNLDTGRVYTSEVTGKPDLRRLPAGTYTALTWIFSGIDATRTMLVEPSIDLTRDIALTADARVAKPVEVTVPQADAESVLAAVEMEVLADQGSFSFGLWDVAFDDIAIGQRDPTSRSDRFTSAITRQWVKGGAGDQSPYAYRLMWAVDGHLPTGFTRKPAAGDLATVAADYASQGVPTGVAYAYGVSNKINSVFSAELPVTLPGTSTEYFSTEGGVKWYRDLAEGDFPEIASYAMSPATRFEPGRRYTERRNTAAFGPGFDGAFPDLQRFGDQMFVAPQLHSPGVAGPASVPSPPAGRSSSATARCSLTSPRPWRSCRRCRRRRVPTR